MINFFPFFYQYIIKYSILVTKYKLSIGISDHFLIQRQYDNIDNIDLSKINFDK